MPLVAYPRHTNSPNKTGKLLLFACNLLRSQELTNNLNINEKFRALSKVRAVFMPKMKEITYVCLTYLVVNSWGSECVCVFVSHTCLFTQLSNDQLT